MGDDILLYEGLPVLVDTLAILTIDGKHGERDDTLCRDRRGGYYLHRQTAGRDVGAPHRVSLLVAAQWAVGSWGKRRCPLHDDLARALRPGRSVPASRDGALPALADQWERQAARLDELNAAVPGGTLTASIRAELLRENAEELRAALARKGGI